MNPERILDMYCTAHQIPASIFSGKTLLYNGNHTVQDFSLPMYLVASLPARLPRVWYAVTPEQLQFGGILLPDSDMLMLTGPVIPRPCSRMQASEIICRLGRRKSDIPVLMHGLDSFRQTDLTQLKAMLTLLAVHFYGNASEHDAADAFPAPEQIAFSWASIFPSPAIELHDQPDEDTYGIAEESLLSCIQYGKSDRLEQLLNELIYISPQRVTDFDPDTKRQYITGANLLCSRKAVAGGLPIAMANRLADHYLDKIAMTGSSGLDHLFYRMMMDYTCQVRKINLSSFCTPVAAKVHHYIYAHIYEKLSAKELADALHLTEPYLCRSFKKETGLTVVTHISRCKIKEAEYLLSTRQYTASEISDLLCFSSQSYFTSVFRRYTGMTPLAYQASRNIFQDSSEVKLHP